ncbi:MAG: PP0621 family protein [Gammaproteobacteria bacterium]|jgi:hypothetical protein
MRLLVLIVVIGLLLYFINSWIKLLKFKGPDSAGGKRDDSERMVQCRYCGSYLPESRAVSHGEDFFCSREHLRKHLTDET